MKTTQTLCAIRENYVAPDFALAEFVTERGFADSIEIVGKDEEVDAF